MANYFYLTNSVNTVTYLAEIAPQRKTHTWLTSHCLWQPRKIQACSTCKLFSFPALIADQIQCLQICQPSMIYHFPLQSFFQSSDGCFGLVTYLTFRSQKLHSLFRRQYPLHTTGMNYRCYSFRDKPLGKQCPLECKIKCMLIFLLPWRL